MSPGPEAIIWTDASRTHVVRELHNLLAEKVQFIGYGGPRSSEVEALARELDVEAYDDLRKLLVDKPASYLLLATMEDVQTVDILAAMEAGAIVLTIEPIAAEHGELSNLFPKVHSEGRYELVPAFMQTKGWHSAADPVELLGDVKLINYTSFARRDTHSLFAQLIDSWRVILRFAPPPVDVESALSGPLQRAPEDPRDLAGHMTVHARLTNGAGCTMQLSDLAGTRMRRLEVIGKQGMLQVDDQHYQLYDNAEGKLDASPMIEEPASFARLLADQWSDLLRQSPVSAQRPDKKNESLVLACALACLLSARTGQPESPERLLQMQG